MKKTKEAVFIFIFIVISVYAVEYRNVACGIIAVFMITPVLCMLEKYIPWWIK